LFVKIKNLFVAFHHFILRKIVPRIQFVLVSALLFSVYFIAFGITVLFLRIFCSKQFYVPKKQNSFWVEYKDDDDSFENALHQS